MAHIVVHLGGSDKGAGDCQKAEGGSAFWELDSDLQPRGKEGPKEEKLSQLYDEAKVWLFGDFSSRKSRNAGRLAGGKLN